VRNWGIDNCIHRHPKNPPRNAVGLEIAVLENQCARINVAAVTVGAVSLALATTSLAL
jgi:hypothetical protein